MEFIVSVMVTKAKSLLAAIQKCWFLGSDDPTPVSWSRAGSLGFHTPTHSLLLKSIVQGVMSVGEGSAQGADGT